MRGFVGAMIGGPRRHKKKSIVKNSLASQFTRSHVGLHAAHTSIVAVMVKTYTDKDVGIHCSQNEGCENERLLENGVCPRNNILPLSTQLEFLM